MKIAVIRVSMFEGKSHDAMKPLIFPILAGLTPSEHEMTFYDDRIEPLPETIHADLIALSGDTFSAKRSYILARRYRRAGAVVAIGGFHATVCPEECGRYCDAVMVGDAEDTWPALLTDVQAGCPKKQYISSSAEPFGAIDHNHHAFDGKRYAPLGVVQFSRGCKFHCDFCSIKTMYPKAVRQKHLDTIIGEIKSMREKLLFFIDDNLFLDEESAIRLFEAMKPLKKKWACQISMDVANNDRLLSVMKQSGCFLVLIGFESLNRKNLEQMNKKANLRTESYEQAIQNIYRHGLLIYATFVLGYDYDTPETVRQTMEFALEHKFAVANFNPLIPMPGTTLYKRLEQEGRLLHPAWWLSNTCHYGDTVYEPKGMSPEELRSACMEARFRYYSPGGIWKRWLGNRLHWRFGNLIVYLLINLISRSEIHRKQGRLLGGILHETDTD